MPKSRVLVIDDDAMITKLLEEHLSNEGCEVEAVHMAEEGFAKAVESPPDLILLDVMLPDATGFQMLGRFRQNPATHSVPIIMMTGSAKNANQKDIGKNMGANDYVLKPFSMIEIGEKVHHLLKTSPAKYHAPSESAPTPMAEIEPIVPPEPDLQEPPRALPRTPFEEELMRLEENPAPAERPVAMEFSPYERTNVPFLSEKPVIPVEPKALPPEPEMEPAAAHAPAVSWKIVVSIFAVHLVVTLAGAKTDLIRAATFAAGGWALLLGLLVATCAALTISLEAGAAVGILAWAAIPIVLRALSVLLAGWVPALVPLQSIVDSAQLPSLVFWLRPLDAFEIASMLILGLSLHRRPGSSLKKSLFATLMITLAWCLTARGYFRPF